MTFRFNAEKHRRYVLIDAELLEETGTCSYYKVGLAPDGVEKITIKLPNSEVCEAAGKVFIQRWLLHVRQKEMRKIFHAELAK